MREPRQGFVLGLFPFPSPGTTSRDIADARSVTLIIHGVGNPTHEDLLAGAVKGYDTSGLGGGADQITLPECPSISHKKKGAEALVFQSADGPHFLVVLPWSDRFRLSDVAKLSSVALLMLAAVMIVTFIFRDLLDSLSTWLEPWSHKIMAVIALSILSGILHALNPSPAKGKFRPPIGYLMVPVVLILVLDYFVEGTWLWIPLALIIAVLWLMSTTILVQCLRIAPSFGWRLALGGLIIALTLPEVAMLHIARQAAVRSAMRSDEADRAAKAARHDAINAYFSTGGTHVDRPPNFDDPPPKNDAAPQKGAATKPKGLHTPDSHMTKEDYLQGTTPNTSRRTRDSHLTTNTSADSDDDEESDDYPTAPRSYATTPLEKFTPLGNLNIPGVGTYKWTRQNGHLGLVRVDPIKESERVTWPEFASRMIVLAVCLGLCWFAMAFGWMLDLAFDVLHYGGNERKRTRLVEGTVNTIQWFHNQAPNAQIIVIGHSLGSVIAAHAVALLSASESWSRQIVLVTMGSPLNYLNRAFPKTIKNSRELSHSLCEHVRWINLWRRSDFIGKALDFETDAQVQYCVGRGGHANYWSDGAVWRAVAHETLGLSNGPETQRPSAREFSLLERRLVTLVIAAIAFLTLCGAGLWSIRF